MKDLTYIKVKEGKLFGTDMVKPEHCIAFTADDRFCNACSNNTTESCSNKEKAFNQSFIEVGNPDDVKALWPFTLANVNDGVYPVSGLQFEVRYDNPCIKLKKCMAVYNCAQLHGNHCQAEVKVAILSLKQEQPSEEKEGEEIKCTACDGKGWLPHTPPPVEGEKEERIEGLNGAADRYVSMHEDSAVTSMYGHHYRTFLAGANWQEKRTASRIKALEEQVSMIPLRKREVIKEVLELRGKVKALEERLDDIDTFLALEEDASHGDYGKLVTHLRGKILDKLKH